MSDSYSNPTPLQSQHANEDLGRDLTPLQARKRLLRTTTGTDRQPLKRTRVTETHQTSLDHPEPRFPGRPVSFPRDFPEPRHDLPARVYEWLETVPEARPGSDSHHSTRWVSEMGNSPGADGQDAGGGSVPVSGPTVTSGTSPLVKDPIYRVRNLEENGITLLHPLDPMPEPITSLVNHVGRRRGSLGPLLDEIRLDRALHDLSMGAPESQVKAFFHRRDIFPYPDSSSKIQRDDRTPMAKHTVPSSGSEHRVSNPIPDMLYGYNRRTAFTLQEAQLISMGTRMDANSHSLAFPFLTVELKGSGHAETNLWVATNQCLGASACCVNAAGSLCRRLNNGDSDQIRLAYTATFSIAMNGTEARLYISWKHDDQLSYYMAWIKSFLLQRPEDYRDFRNLPESGEQQVKPHQSSLDSSAAPPNRAKAVEDLPEGDAPEGDSPEEEEDLPETIAPDAPTTPTLRRSLRLKSLRSTAQNADSQS
ncbi:hypothetical protein RB596_009507 [Gaeumannomyces avenae]